MPSKECLFPSLMLSISYKSYVGPSPEHLSTDSVDKSIAVTAMLFFTKQTIDTDGALYQ